MRRIEEYDRRQARKRLSVILVAGFGLVTVVYTLAHRQWEDDGRLEVVRVARATLRTTSPTTAEAAPQAAKTVLIAGSAPQSATAVVTAESAPQTATTLVKAVGVPLAATRPVISEAAQRALAKAGVMPNDIVLAIDRKQVRDALQAAQYFNGVPNCRPVRIEVVRDGRPFAYTIPSPNNGRCGDGPVMVHRP